MDLKYNISTVRYPIGDKREWIERQSLSLSLSLFFFLNLHN